MPDPKTAEVRDLLKHLAKYLATPPTLADGEACHLTLTSDGKLRVDDPTTQEKIDDVEAKLDHATYGLAALKTLIDAVPTTPELEADALIRYNVLAAYVDEVESILKNVTYGLSALKAALDVAQADLDNPGQYKADVSALALEASLTAIKGVGWTTETLKAIKDAIATAQADLDNPSQYKADVTNLDAAVSSRLAAAAYTAERGTDNAALASVCTETRLARLDADVSSRLATASYTAERGTDNAMLAVNGALEATLTAIKGTSWTVETLKAIYDLVAAGGGGATAQQVWEYVTRTLTNLSDTRAAKIDNLDALTSSRLGKACQSINIRLNGGETQVLEAGLYSVIYTADDYGETSGTSTGPHLEVLVSSTWYDWTVTSAKTAFPLLFYADGSTIRFANGAAAGTYRRLVGVRTY